MGADIDNHSVGRAYARWAPVYDLVFDRVMANGRRAAVAAAVRVGHRILDVGVGTGLELPYFPADKSIIGIDLSEPMLHKARARVAECRLRQVTGLCVMDAAHLAIADGVFDAAVAPYVLTVVPTPDTMLDELLRVVRPGGEIILINHFSAARGPRATCEKWLARQTRHLGWRPEFPWSWIESWCSARCDVDLVERSPIPPFGLFTLVRLRKRPSEDRSAHAA
jgi:phosphatidylethanolamine/phosphatidyl-N-methylethanolamine N-methyltransferase